MSDSMSDSTSPPPVPPPPAFYLPLFDQIEPARREAILNAAAEEFANQGFAQATIAAIAQSAGVSVGSLYKYFEDKKALYLTVVQRGYELISQAIAPALVPGPSLESRLETLVEAIFEHTRSHRTMTRLYNRFTTESDPELAARLAQTIESITAQTYTALIAQAKAEGTLVSAVDDRVLAFGMDSLFLMLQFSLAEDYYRDRMLIYLGDAIAHDKEGLKKQVLAFLCQALGVQRSKQEH